MHSYAIVWIDHRRAKVIFFNADDADTSPIRAAEQASHLHSKAGSASGTHLHGEPTDFDEVARAMAPP
jgi:dTDP-4-dehydrorhamnose 3,5-epimerase-like enzyme